MPCPPASTRAWRPKNSASSGAREIARRHAVHGENDDGFHA